jgi:sugar/nucleoside kinase (ribokinase family)
VSLIVIGSVALDSVETPFGVREEVLGGSASYFSIVASFFTKVRLVAVVGDDFPQEHIDLLERHGVDLGGLERKPAGRTFRWKGRYGENLNEAHTLDTELNVLETFDPVLPERFRDAEYVFLANIDPVLQSRVLDQVRAPKFVACDTMNFWIDKSLPALRQILERVDCLIINDGEARALSGETNISRAAKRIRAMGPKQVVIKRGEYGALVFDDEVFAVPAFPLEEVHDPTGAGDSFAGGFMGHLASTRRADFEAVRCAAVMGSVAASFAVEEFSLDGLRTLTLAELRERYAAFRRLVYFE